MSVVTVNKTVSFDNLIRSGSIMITLLTGVWWFSGELSELKLANLANKDAIAAIQTNVAHLSELVVSTNTLATIASNRIDNASDAIRDIRTTQDKANDRMNGFQTELSRVARNSNGQEKIR